MNSWAYYLDTVKHRLYPQVAKKDDYVQIEVKLSNEDGKAFIDSGCTFNAITIAFAKKAGISFKTFSNPIVCEIGLNKTMTVERRVAEVEFDLGPLGSLQTYVYVMDSLPLHKDAIFGMDFLKSVNPIIDWRAGDVRPNMEDKQAYQTHDKLHFHRFTPHVSSSGETMVISFEEYEQLLKEEAESLFFTIHPKPIADTAKVKRFKEQNWEILKENPAYPILNKYKDTVFAEKLDVTKIRQTREFQHEIDLTDDTPFNIKQFRLSPQQQEAVEKWTGEMAAAGLIRKSSSPFNSPIFCAKKPIGWRIVHDFRLLNSRTKIPREPIPRKDEIIDAMSNAYYFSCMDLLSGYYQLLLREGDTKLTAFSTPSGHYEYVVIAQGLAGAPSTFNRFVQAVFAALRDICRAFFDDVFIFTKNESIECHLEALDRVLKRCEEEGITIKLSKCVFLAEEIPVLGDFVGRNGVRIDPDKVAVIKSWPIPRKVSEMKSFLGKIVYCSKFLKDYGRLVAPLQKAIAGNQNKNDPIELSDDQLIAFNRLKQAMVEAPVLGIADFNKPFGIRMDACDFAIGGVLFQVDERGDEHPIAYTGRRMNNAELKYPVREKELLAIMHALRVWRPYLLDRPFQVETDHHSIETLLTQRNCTQRLARWLNELSEYRPEFKWIPGVTNQTADGISRRTDFIPNNGKRASVIDLRDLLRSILAQNDADEAADERQLLFTCMEHAELFCYLLSERDIKTQCREGYPVDREFAEAWKHVQEEGRDSYGKFRYHNELLWHVGDDESPWRLCIPENDMLRNQILFSEHDVIVKGHPGRYKTERFMTKKYYWKGMTKFIHNYCDTCQKCSRNKHRQTKPPGRLNPLPIPEARWEDITMDFIVDLPLSDGSNAIWVIMDRMSKRGHFIPVKMGDGESSALECARTFCKEYIRLHGIPTSIISDRDVRFKSEFWSELMKLLETEHEMSSAFRPQTDGQSERSNRFIEDYLRNYVHPRQHDWSQYLYSADFAYNSRYHESIKMSPFEADLGYIPKSFPEHVYARLLGSKSSRSDAYEFGKIQQQILETAKKNLTEAQARMKQYYDKNRPIQNFEIGDRVYISSKNLDIEHLGVIAKGSRKLAPLWIGPYPVISKTTPDTYRVRLPFGLRLHPEFHTSLLKPYLEDPTSGRNNKPNKGMIAAGGHNDSFLVESIVGHRKRNGKIEYQVKWLGYSDEENTWEPLENLLRPVRNLLEDYIERKKLKKAKWLKL